MRKPVQVAMEQGRILVLCEDGTIWAGVWGMAGSKSWKAVPSIPDAGMREAKFPYGGDLEADEAQDRRDAGLE